jgi:hypothetical protein
MQYGKRHESALCRRPSAVWRHRTAKGSGAARADPEGAPARRADIRPQEATLNKRHSDRERAPMRVPTRGMPRASDIIDDAHGLFSAYWHHASNELRRARHARHGLVLPALALRLQTRVGLAEGLYRVLQSTVLAISERKRRKRTSEQKDGFPWPGR